MTKTAWFYLCIVFGFCVISCAKSYEKYQVFLEKTLQADTVVLAKSHDTSILEVSYNRNIAISSELLSSSACLRLLDTAHKDFEKDNIRFIKVNIRTPQETSIYNYPLAIAIHANKGIQKSSEFLKNFLNNQLSTNLSLVDTTIISQASLENLAIVSQQIQLNMPVSEIAFDGFVALEGDKNVIEIRSQLLSKNEALPVVIHYHIQKGKIFYFGINES
jgi:hypothetical protein